MRTQALFLSAFLTFGAIEARPAIVLEDNPVEDESTGKHIDVPKPNDGISPDEKAAAPTDLMRFINNDTLHGTLLACGKTDGVHWQSLESKEPIIFQTANVAEIKLDSHKPPANGTAASYAVTLTNKDELLGNLVSFDEKTLLLDTWYAGKLSIPHAMVQTIVPVKTSMSTLYEGPVSMDGWISGQNGNRGKNWRYRDGALTSTSYGTIGRDVKLPNLSKIDFDLTARGNSQVSVCIYGEKPDNIANCYMFQINASYIYLQRYSRDGSTNLSDQPVQLRGAMVQHPKIHFSVRVNKETKTFWLFVNGTMVQQWTDTAEFAGKGTSLIFSSQQGMYTRVSDIKVSSWDGEIEGAQTANQKSKDDNIKLQNQDKVSGKLKRIENGNAVFASSYADLTIPLSRVEKITMSSEGADQAKRNTNDVRAFFSDRGSITMELESWDGKQAVANSPNFGKATFSTDAFQRLEFNLNRHPVSADGDDIDAIGDDQLSQLSN